MEERLPPEVANGKPSGVDATGGTPLAVRQGGEEPRNGLGLLVHRNQSREVDQGPTHGSAGPFPLQEARKSKICHTPPLPFGAWEP